MYLESFAIASTSCCVYQYVKQKNMEYDNTIDSLTGIYNRKIMKKIKKIDNRNNKFSIIAYDIDHFKNVNDTYGHATGDIVLQSISKIIYNNVKQKKDYCVRFGGEEFFTFINERDKNIVKSIAERIRKSIEEQRIVVDGEIIKITISIGISYSEDAKNINNRIEISDKRLYISKQTGRNKVTDED